MSNFDGIVKIILIFAIGYSSGAQNGCCRFNNPSARQAPPGVFSGISRSVCETNNFCFDDTVSGVPFCFYPDSEEVCHTIQSRRITNWGNWGSWATCLSGEYVEGFQVKREVEELDPFNDDFTGINGVKLLCRKPGAPTSTRKVIQSTEGPFGTWGSNLTCPLTNSFIYAFYLDVQPKQASGKDDRSAIGVRMWCNYNDNVLSEQSGTFSTFKYACKPGFLVCGIRAQVEGSQGAFVDDTALNNLDLKCCKAPTENVCLVT